MSYYDHASMMAHKLGPWADDPENERAKATVERRRPGSSAIGRAVKRLLVVLAGETTHLKPQVTGTDQKVSTER
jgi:hypothetical protein